MAFFTNLEPCLIGMEAYGRAHYWARQLQSLGHEVKLIAPQFVKPFVKANKHDVADPEAICEAVSRPNMRFLSIKNVEQQSMLYLHRAREGFIGDRTASVNCIRGLFDQLLDHLKWLDKQLDQVEAHINAWHRQSADSQRLALVPGIGPLIATAVVVTVGDARNFKNGRQLAAWIGLVPRQNSTGGKQTLLGISKRGDAYLRKMLIHGARALAYHTARKADPSNWLTKIIGRRNMNIAVVAQANKTARIVWALLAHGREFRPDCALKAAS